MAKKILVPLDRSLEAEAVVPLVAAAARDSGGTARLLCVRPVPESRQNEEGRVVAYADQEMARLEAEALDYLRSVQAQLTMVGVGCVVRFGDPVEEILQEAEAFGADLIAVTTMGRSALGRAVLGSVAEQVVRKARPAVVLLRPSRDHS